jgi:hypothetical protein
MLQLRRTEVLVILTVITLTTWALPDWPPLIRLWNQNFGNNRYEWLPDVALLLVAILLALPAPIESGLCIGSIRQHWDKVLLVCGVLLLVTAIVYPQLPVRPFFGTSPSMWILSPFAQDLLFGGVFLRFLLPLYPNRIHPKFDIPWALPIAACFFSGWHMQNFYYLSSSYVLFQMLYTWLGYVIMGMTRIWTGSIFYVVLAHSGGNYIAWATP